jgi:hypothetical protein
MKDRPQCTEVGYRYSYTHSLTSAIDWDRLSTPHPFGFTPGNDMVSIFRRLGGSQGPSGRVPKISHTPGFDPRTTQTVASRYTD